MAEALEAEMERGVDPATLRPAPKRVWGPTPSQLRGQQRSNAKRGLQGWLERTSRRLGEREAVELAQLVIEEWVKTVRL